MWHPHHVHVIYHVLESLKYVLVLVHVVMMAPCDMIDLENRFRSQLPVCNHNLELVIHRPLTGKSFGAVNRAVLDEVKRMAREEGVLVDPIYMAKLSLTVREIWSRVGKMNQGLMVHSGGAMSLPGFWDRLLS